MGKKKLPEKIRLSIFMRDGQRSVADIEYESDYDHVKQQVINRQNPIVIYGEEDQYINWDNVNIIFMAALSEEFLAKLEKAKHPASEVPKEPVVEILG